MSMSWLLETPDVLAGSLRGIERESLRITPNGQISTEPHPIGLGSKLCHPSITTDFAESLVEIVTTPKTSALDAMSELTNIDYYVRQHCEDTLFWPASMPGIIDLDRIEIAQYGSSCSGQMKMAYRRGLIHRYGKVMQIIAGVHYNFSLPERFWQTAFAIEKPTIGYRKWRDQRYMRLVRNFMSVTWLVYYLFGASPVAMSASLNNQSYDFLKRQGDYYLGENATCLRLSDIGYRNLPQVRSSICYQNIESYAQSLLKATATPAVEFADIPVVDEQGVYQQLNQNLLQIENEFYNPIRPKQPVVPGERPAASLLKRGVTYVEVRTLDLNPFMPLGIDINTQVFLDMLLTWCVLQPEQTWNAHARDRYYANNQQVLTQGRKANLVLNQDDDTTIRLNDWGKTLLSDLKPIADAFDVTTGCAYYGQSLEAQIAKLEDTDQTPSAKVQQYVEKEGGYISAMMKLAQQHEQTQAQFQPDTEQQATLKIQGDQSLLEAKKLCAKQSGCDLGKYLECYFSSK